MPDLFQPEEEAVRYLFGDLTRDERREFELRLAHSPELRAAVRELEEGAAALSMAAPARRPPDAVWKGIQEAIRTRSQSKLSIWERWHRFWRSGWAAAAACLIGWLLYALWPIRPNSQRGSSVQLPSSAQQTVPAPAVTSHPDNIATRQSGTRLEKENTLTLLQSRTQEIRSLSWQIADLTNRMSQLSQSLTQQQALLSEPNRVKFFQLAPPLGNSNGMAGAPISPALQQALFLAMARELGWTPPGSSGKSQESGKSDERPASAATASTNASNVDFVDLRPGTNSPEVSPSQPHNEPEQVAISEPPTTPPASNNAVPGFVSGTNAVLAFDSSIVPSGTSLNFWSVSGSGQVQSLGSAVLYSNPLVVTVPFGITTWQDRNLIVSAIMFNGQSNVIGQFFNPGTTGP